jgi:hypothetical protein
MRKSEKPDFLFLYKAYLMGSLRDLRLRKPKKEEPVDPTLTTWTDFDIANYVVGNDSVLVTYMPSNGMCTLSINEDFQVEVEVDGTTYNVTIAQLKEIAKASMENGLVDLGSLSP